MGRNVIDRSVLLNRYIFRRNQLFRNFDALLYEILNRACVQRNGGGQGHGHIVVLSAGRIRCLPDGFSIVEHGFHNVVTILLGQLGGGLRALGRAHGVDVLIDSVVGARGNGYASMILAISSSLKLITFTGTLAFSCIT